MSKTQRKKIANADLVAAVRNHREQILQFCEQLEDERPVILLDVQRRKLHSYRYEDYRSMLRKESQAKLDQEYERAVAKNKVLVVVWDNATRRLVTNTFKRR
jgi:hypothetical protein